MKFDRQSKADLHVHSKYSDRPSEWFLRRIGAPECFVEPRDVYRRLCERGMDFVTISDHNCIRGALEIADLPGTFVSSEITTYFPEDGCKIHCLAIAITEDQFSMIQRLRGNVYDLHEYLVEQDVICSVAHPLFRINDRLTPEHVEKLLLMFERFEGINGVRDSRAGELTSAILGSLTPELIEQMADRHGIEPHGSEPWKKWLTGGSDDHSGAYGGAAYTVTPYAQDVDEFLAHLRRGDHQAAGAAGSSLLLAHGLYHIAYSYYKARFLGAGGNRPSVIAALFERLLAQPQEPPSRPQPVTFGQRIAGFVTRSIKARKLRKLGEAERVVVEEFSALFHEDPWRDSASVPEADRHAFRIACRIGHLLSYNFLVRFEKHVREGRLLDSLQTIASLAPVALSFAPYLAAFRTQHKDAAFLEALSQRFPIPVQDGWEGRRKAWVTDTFADVNGVCRTIHTLAAAAKKTGKRLTVITCLKEPPSSSIDLRNFQPVGTVALPEYDSIELCFPPFLEVIEYIERHRFNEVVISTPGPLGITALAAAKLLGLRATGIYHTDFPAVVRDLTEDDGMQQVTWRYVQWFYDQMDRIVVPSKYYHRHLVENGFEPHKLYLMGRGVDPDRFNPAKRDTDFWGRYGLDRAFKFLYVGRVAPDKNVDLLLESFKQLLEQGRTANLVVVGDGPSLSNLQSRYKHRRIVFTGFLEGEDLATAMASADAFVFPSTTDTFGNAVLEAQASGLPAIVSDRGGPPELVRAHQSGIIVDVGQPLAFAKAMDQLLGDPRLRADLRSRALRSASERDWNQVLDDFWNWDQPADTRARATPRERGAAESLTGPGILDVA
jgi:glycosyltransferase involved in cell wall biosynthesis